MVDVALAAGVVEQDAVVAVVDEQGPAPAQAVGRLEHALPAPEAAEEAAGQLGVGGERVPRIEQEADQRHRPALAGRVGDLELGVRDQAAATGQLEARPARASRHGRRAEQELAPEPQRLQRHAGAAQGDLEPREEALTLLAEHAEPLQAVGQRPLRRRERGAEPLEVLARHAVGEGHVQAVAVAGLERVGRDPEPRLQVGEQAPAQRLEALGGLDLEVDDPLVEEGHAAEGDLDRPGRGRQLRHAPLQGPRVRRLEAELQRDVGRRLQVGTGAAGGLELPLQAADLGGGAGREEDGDGQPVDRWRAKQAAARAAQDGSHRLRDQRTNAAERRTHVRRCLEWNHGRTLQEDNRPSIGLSALAASSPPPIPTLTPITEPSGAHAPTVPGGPGVRR